MITEIRNGLLLLTICLGPAAYFTPSPADFVSDSVYTCPTECEEPTVVFDSGVVMTHDGVKLFRKDDGTPCLGSDEADGVPECGDCGADVDRV